MQYALPCPRCTCGRCGMPAAVAFAGKRQWMELLNVGRRGRDKYTRLEHGLQAMRPKVTTLCPAWRLLLT